MYRTDLSAIAAVGDARIRGVLSRKALAAHFGLNRTSKLSPKGAPTLKAACAKIEDLRAAGITEVSFVHEPYDATDRSVSPVLLIEFSAFSPSDEWISAAGGLLARLAASNGASVSRTAIDFEDAVRSGNVEDMTASFLADLLKETATQDISVADLKFDDAARSGQADDMTASFLADLLEDDESDGVVFPEAAAINPEILDALDRDIAAELQRSIAGRG